MSLDPGKMRFRIAIERRSDAQDAAGQQLDEWSTFASRRASQEGPEAGSEPNAAQQQVGRMPTTWRLRFVAGVLPSMRVRVGQRVYDIVSAADPDGMKRELVLTTLERVGEAP